MKSRLKEYYVSSAGDDNNSGQNPLEPWKSISKVNSFSFQPGDKIFFKKGDTWRERLAPKSGSANGYIVYSSYGFGNKPKLLGSVNISDPGSWVLESANIWTTAGSAGVIGTDVGNIIFNGGSACGIKVLTESEMNGQNKFWYDNTNKRLKIYSSGNPASLYSSIECALTRDIIRQDNASYIVYKGLDLKYGGACGINGESTHHIKIVNCDMSYIGGGTHINAGRTVRYGNAVNFWDNAHDNVVDGCRIWEIYDAAVSNQGNGAGAMQYNIKYTNNTIWNCEYSYEYWNSGTGAITHDIFFEYNYCKNAGFGWGHTQRPDPKGIHILMGNKAQLENFVVMNNKIENAKHLDLSAYSWNNTNELFLDYNEYTQTKNKDFAYYLGKTYYTYNFDEYKQTSGKDAHSTLTFS